MGRSFFGPGSTFWKIAIYTIEFEEESVEVGAYIAKDIVYTLVTICG